MVISGDLSAEWAERSMQQLREDEEATSHHHRA
jgi:hypothetical protein